jgi:hypothetical protein
MAALLACTLLPAASPPPEVAKPARFAVVAVGQCSAASSAISARSFRALLQPKLGASLQSEADTARALGGLSERTLEEVERGVAAARKDFYAHKGDAAVAYLKELAVDVTRIAPSEERWKVERDVVTLLAQAQLPSDSSAAEAAVISILRVEPGYQPDTGLYPPSFRKFVDGIRARQAEVPTNRLDIGVSPSGTPVYVGGCPVGAAPLSHHFPAGEYRVEADFGHRGLVRNVIVPDPPALVAPIQLAASVEGSLLADGGPCVEPGPDRPASLARLTALVGASRLLGVRTDTSAGRRWLLVAEVDATGSLLREARSQIQPGSPETDALSALAEWVATDRAGSAVEVLKRITTVSTPTASQQNARAVVSGHLVGQPLPNGFNLQTFSASGQLVAGPAVHFQGDKFKRADQPEGRSSVRVVTDDGRVGTALVDVPAGGNVDVTVRVDQACTATGRVITSDRKPAAGAHVLARHLKSRIPQSIDAGPRGGFVFRELTKGDYQLSVELGERHLVRQFALTSSCTANLGMLVLPDAPSATKPPSGAQSDAGPRGQ